jgi:dienelactone hydrolase
MSCGEVLGRARLCGLLVDSFGPRGYARGFEAGTNDGSRPASVNEITVRPLDAYAALKFLRNQPGVIKDQVFLQGWSNGGSTALSAASTRARALSRRPRPPASGPS